MNTSGCMSLHSLSYVYVVKSDSAKHGSSNGSRGESSGSGARNMSPAVPEGSGVLGWVSSWFTPPVPDTGKQVQAMKKASPSPGKGTTTHHPLPRERLALIEYYFTS